MQNAHSGFIVCRGRIELVALSIPMLLRRVKPNPWYGFRTRKSLANEQVWYEVNAHAGKQLLIAGNPSTVATKLFTIIPGVNVNLYAWLVLAVVVITLRIGLA